LAIVLIEFWNSYKIVNISDKKKLLSEWVVTSLKLQVISRTVTPGSAVYWCFKG